QCRDIQAALNESVLEAYGLDEIELELGFHEVGYLPDGRNTRFTMSEKARREILRSLAELNRQRYQEEVDQGLHGGAAGSGKARGRKTRAVSASEPTLDLEDTLPTTIEGGD